jgi:hypothetical protein
MAQAICFPSQAPDPSLYPASILDVALNEYRKNTGNDLLSHPLAIELQRCDSVDDILAILQRQANTFEQSRDSNRGLMKWISPSVHILYSFSAALGDGVGLVRLGNERMATEVHSDVIVRRSHLRNQSLLGLVFCWPSVSSPFLFVHTLIPILDRRQRM